MLQPSGQERPEPPGQQGVVAGVRGDLGDRHLVHAALVLAAADERGDARLAAAQVAFGQVVQVVAPLPGIEDVAGHHAVEAPRRRASRPRRAARSSRTSGSDRSSRSPGFPARGAGPGASRRGRGTARPAARPRGRTTPRRRARRTTGQRFRPNAARRWSSPGPARWPAAGPSRPPAPPGPPACRRRGRGEDRGLGIGDCGLESVRTTAPLARRLRPHALLPSPCRLLGQAAESVMAKQVAQPPAIDLPRPGLVHGMTHGTCASSRTRSPAQEGLLRGLRSGFAAASRPRPLRHGPARRPACRISPAAAEPAWDRPAARRGRCRSRRPPGPGNRPPARARSPSRP